MIPYSRPKLSDLYTLAQNLKLLENHTLPSGTYLYMAHIWQSLPPRALTPNSRSGLFFKAITVGSSSGFNFKLLHDWSNFDLPKLMPVEHISLMPSSCLSLTNTRQDTRQ